MDKIKWGKIIERDNKEIAGIEKAKVRYEKARDKADKKAEMRELRKYEKELDKGLGISGRKIRRDFW